MRKPFQTYWEKCKLLSLILAVASSCLVAVNLVFIVINLRGEAKNKKMMVAIGIFIVVLCLISAIINFNASEVI